MGDKKSGYKKEQREVKKQKLQQALDIVNASSVEPPLSLGERPGRAQVCFSKTCSSMNSLTS